MLACKELRRNGWDSMHGKWGGSIGITILYGLILVAVSFTGIGGLILGGPLLFGLTAYFINLQRQREASVNNLFSGFSNFGNTLVAYILQNIFIALWSILLVIPGIIKSFSYSMTFYILNDHPELSGSEAITRSREMMNGYKGKLFLLNLSFIGWYLLIAITMGIAALWVTPYVKAAEAAFYEELKAERGEPTVAAQPEPNTDGAAQ